MLCKIFRCWRRTRRNVFVRFWMVMAESDVQSKEEGKTMVFIPVGRTVQRPTILPTTCSFRRLYVHVCLFAVVVIVILVLRAISNVRVVFVQYHSSSDTDGELVVLPEKFAVSRGAYCLDGSSPGYYIRYGEWHSVIFITSASIPYVP